ncbi:MAG: hypothetical protein V1838_01790 [Patescibacteria group bacterium]
MSADHKLSEEVALEILGSKNIIIKGSHIVYTPKEHPKGSGNMC